MIGSSMFNNCLNLKEVTCGGSITTIADKAFYNCTALEKFIFPNSLLTIGDNAFYNCTSLKEIILNEGLSTIGTNAFVNCSGTEKIVIPNSIIYVTKGMLKGCSSLETLVIPFVGSSNMAMTSSSATLVGFIFGSTQYNGSTKVEQNYTDTATSTYYIPTNLKRIDVTGSTDILYGAFSNIPSLKEITIPSSMINIDANIIKGSTNLELIYYRGTESNWNSVNKNTNWDKESSNYDLRFVPGNLVRVIDKLKGTEEFSAKLYDSTGTNLLYEGLSTYYGSGLENISNGTYLLKVTKGDKAYEKLIEVNGDLEINVDGSNMDILEQFKDREMIIVLTWGENPRDLDSHITYTDDSSSYHIYYNNKIDSTTGTNLDIDDVTSYGPEVVTVLKLQDGIYRYSVYDYTHGGSSTSNGLSNSNAKVELYIDGELINTYHVPEGYGCLWTVIEYNGSNKEITSINTITGGMTSEQVR